MFLHYLRRDKVESSLILPVFLGDVLGRESTGWLQRKKSVQEPSSEGLGNIFLMQPPSHIVWEHTRSVLLGYNDLYSLRCCKELSICRIISAFAELLVILGLQK